jgi:hypothetical protein
MDTNSQTLFTVRQAEHQIRLRQSERIRDAEQAASIQPTQRHVHPVRARMSAVLTAAAERMWLKPTMKPAQADPIR